MGDCQRLLSVHCCLQVGRENFERMERGEGGGGGFGGAGNPFAGFGFGDGGQDIRWEFGGNAQELSMEDIMGQFFSATGGRGRSGVSSRTRSSMFTATKPVARGCLAAAAVAAASAVSEVC